MLTLEKTCLACISPPGEVTIIRFFSMDRGRLCFCTKLAATKDWDAPESNKTIVPLLLTRIIPMITSEAAYTSSTATWFTRARAWFCLAEVDTLLLALRLMF
jgi:hypothetical protein